MDLIKAYDNVPVKKLWEALERIKINVTLISAIKQLYNNCRSRVKIGRTLSKDPVTKDLRQGCCLPQHSSKSTSPTYSINDGGNANTWEYRLVMILTLYTLHFADDQVVLAQDKDDLEYIIRKLIEEYER